MTNRNDPYCHWVPYISRLKEGRYRVRIPALKVKRDFLSRSEAIRFRDKILSHS